MFRNPLVVVMHLVIHVGFVIIILKCWRSCWMDYWAPTHRLFFGPLGGLYTLSSTVSEWFDLGVIAVCVVFLARRNILKLNQPRPGMDGPAAMPLYPYFGDHPDEPVPSDERSLI